MTTSKVEIYFFFVIFLAALTLAFFLFLPFLGPLALAAVFAVIFYPLFQWVKRVGGIPFDGLSALVTVLIVVLLVLVPVAFFGYLLFEEARSLFTALSSGNADILGAIQAAESYVRGFLPGFDLDIRGYAQSALGTLTQSLGSIFTGTLQVVFALLLSLITFYYFLKDGPRFKVALMNYSPLRDSYDVEIIEQLKQTINSVIKGSLLIAFLQGIMTGVGFAIFGIPSPVLWGAVAGLGALIPNVGTTIVLIPAILYLFFTGSAGSAVGLLVWGVVAVGLIDNLLGPIFIGRGIKIHPLFILLSVLGGISLFGPLGFILGPIALSLVVVLAHIYASLVVVEQQASK